MNEEHGIPGDIYDMGQGYILCVCDCNMTLILFTHRHDKVVNKRVGSGGEVEKFIYLRR